jgi:fibro-slime domain-containing protein
VISTIVYYRNSKEKFLIIFTLISIFYLQANAQTYPATIKIPITYYDFHSDGSNPEFEKAPTGAPTRLGMVADTLDAQRKPVLGITPYFDCQIAKWFRPWTPGDFTIPNYTNPAATICSNPESTVNYDTAFKNIVIQDTLPFTLVPGSAGIYQYSNAAFFPLDGRGYGNEVAQGTLRTHNYSFSMELHWQFTKVTGLTFQFAGDEDVWVFINNKLVMDIGGIHNETAGSVNVDTLGLTDGKNYMFDFFYCERHVTGAAVRITINILAPPTNNMTKSGIPVSYRQKFSIKAYKNQIVFSIRQDLTENSRIKIQNLSGKLIADFRGSQRTIWNCKSYSAGLYIAQIYLKNALAASIPIVLSP